MNQDVSPLSHRSFGRSAENVVPIDERKAHCMTCAVRALCLPAGLAPDATRNLDRISSRTRVRKRETLYRPGDVFTTLFAIRMGTFKTVLLTEDGREQIIGYHLAGEIIGMDGISESRHSCHSVALEDSEVCGIPFDQLDEMADDVPALRRNLYRTLSKHVCEGQDVMLMLGSRRAEERLALFLLDLAHRYHARGYSSSEFVLRMTREEISSYLGLKLETVSRLFSHLQGEGLISVQGRAVKLMDGAALRTLVGQSA